MEMERSWAPKSQLRQGTTCACLRGLYRPKINSSPSWSSLTWCWAVRMWCPWDATQPLAAGSGTLEKGSQAELDPGKKPCGKGWRGILLSAAQVRCPSVLLLTSWPEEQLAVLPPPLRSGTPLKHKSQSLVSTCHPSPAPCAGEVSSHEGFPHAQGSHVRLGIKPSPFFPSVRAITCCLLPCEGRGRLRAPFASKKPSPLSSRRRSVMMHPRCLHVAAASTHNR